MTNKNFYFFKTKKTSSNWWEWFTVHGLFLQTRWFVLNNGLLLEVWNLLSARERVPICPDHSKNLGHWVSNMLPWAETWHTCCCIFIAGVRVSCVWPTTGSLHMDSCIFQLHLSPLWSSWVSLLCLCNKSSLWAWLCARSWEFF